MTSRVHTQHTRELSSWRLQNKVAVVTGAARGNRPPCAGQRSALRFKRSAETSLEIT
jgi:hypothetical protein